MNKKKQIEKLEAKLREFKLSGLANHEESRFITANNNFKVKFI